jgi:hypothetical protein
MQATLQHLELPTMEQITLMPAGGRRLAREVLRSHDKAVGSLKGKMRRLQGSLTLDYWEL